MPRLVLVLLLLWAPLQAQSVKSFPRIRSVSSVTIVEDFLYFNLEPVIPQSVFRKWWVEMEKCTGSEKSFNDISWYVANVIYNVAVRKRAWGIYYRKPPEIIIVSNLTRARLENTAKHEMLHHLQGGHDEKTFNRCLPFGLEND